MKNEERNEMKWLLNNQRENLIYSILSESRKLNEDIKISNKNVESLNFNHPADSNSIDREHDKSLQLLRLHKRELVQIDSALKRLEIGEYGVCEECGQNINLKRLKAIPFTHFCAECSSELEVMEKSQPSRQISSRHRPVSDNFYRGALSS